MRYAITLGLISAALFATAFVYPSAAFLTIWTALSIGWVAFGYAKIGARVFRKGEDGRIPLLTKILLFPFLFSTWLVWHIYRLVSRESAFNCVDSDLVIGRRLLADEVPDGFDHYVDLTAEFEDPFVIRGMSSYQSFPILDASNPSIQELKSAVENSKHGRTYVHCAQGHGRTGLFALALLIERGRVTTAKEGLDLLQSFRPAISLNREQKGFLERYLKYAEEAKA